MKRYRLLRPDEIECRVQKCKQNGVSLLVYKTARTDADLLDETVGPENWQNRFERIGNVLFCGVGVDYGSGLVWKWDAGAESNTEAEKGEASDAFKRAGFKHGIGRELYSAPFIWVSSDKCNIRASNNKYICYDTFDVSAIEYDEAERIKSLQISTNGAVVFSWRRENNLAGSDEYRPDPNRPKCEICGNFLTPFMGLDKKPHPVADLVKLSTDTFGKMLCYDCVKAESKRKKEANNA